MLSTSFSTTTILDCVSYAQKMISLQEEEARDIVQDVFVKFWKNRQELNIQFSIRSYLFIAVKNKCFDLLRKKKQKYQDSRNHGSK